MKNIALAIIVLALISACNKKEELNVVINDENNVLKNENKLNNSIIEKYDYKIQIVSPDTGIDYKILQVVPDSTIDFKIKIYDPVEKEEVPIPEDIEKLLQETLKKVK
ncbi:hypothetical protein [Carboxylicivirga marina]|uniref:hypothetical protein n=1 Tax=Carboxylicivirga marina TaxID=2800988 RepID=UPI0025973E7C|nr:hypothetical protein [uncultured Carboxylicivirga sp.]